MKKAMCAWVAILICILSACQGGSGEVEQTQSTKETTQKFVPVPNVFYSSSVNHVGYSESDKCALLAELATLPSESFKEKLHALDLFDDIGVLNANQNDLVYCCQFLARVGYFGLKADARTKWQTEGKPAKEKFSYYKPDGEKPAHVEYIYDIDGVWYYFELFDTGKTLNLSGNQFVMNAEIGDITVPLYESPHADGIYRGVYYFEDKSLLYLHVSSVEKDYTDFDFDQFYISYDMCGHYPPELTEQ